jgi:hypothetical protein
MLENSWWSGGRIVLFLFLFVGNVVTTPPQGLAFLVGQLIGALAMTWISASAYAWATSGEDSTDAAEA